MGMSLLARASSVEPLSISLMTTLRAFSFKAPQVPRWILHFAQYS